VTERLPIYRIRTDGGTQVRVAMKPETVLDYAEAMASGIEFPPIVVFFDGLDSWCGDGFHRKEGREKAGFADISCEVREGSLDDAKEFAASANTDHGLRRTNADKRHAVAMILALSEKKFRAGEIEAPWSSPFVADKAKVTHKTVLHVLSEPGWEKYNLLSDKVLGLDGKLYPATREPAVEEPEQPELVELRLEVEEDLEEREQLEVIAGQLVVLEAADRWRRWRRR
jgi:hypothetical protein